ncbi:MAG TPA: phage virion morphogenesis protein [Candidatus Sumerlaeota bacterium]|nr:phage virion morphogenesis protein [Candidatus Sumerlaeota bacterium]
MFKLRLEAQEMEREAKRLLIASRRWKTVLAAFGSFMVAETAQNFKDQGRPEKWQDVKEATKVARWMRGNSSRKRKRTLAGAGAAKFIGMFKILMDSGRLANSITFEANDKQVEIGTNLVYAATHQFGRGAIPARPYLGFQESDVERFLDLINEWLEGSEDGLA